MDSTYVGAIPNFYLVLGDFEAARRWRDSYAMLNTGIRMSSLSAEQQVELLLDEGHTQEAAEIAMPLLGHSSDTVNYPRLLRVIRDHFLDVEREDDALEIYRVVFPGMFREAPDVNRSNAQVAVDLVPILQLVGETSDASKLAEIAFPVLRQMAPQALSGRGLLEVELYAILGERDKAIDSCRTALELNPGNAYFTDLMTRISSEDQAAVGSGGG